MSTRHRLRFTLQADADLRTLETNGGLAKRLKAVRKTLALLETNLRHPGLHTHEFSSLRGAQGEKVFEAYAENRASAAYRVFWHYGPDEHDNTSKPAKRVPVITIIAITPHP
ncbi:MAG: hypothetical protein ACKVPX_14320 [Myxococcaceae bacterium]